MIEIKPPAINGRTTEEKLNELIKYNEHLYDALSRKFENIDISDLNYTFAKKHEQYDEELAKLGRAKGSWDEKRICQDETGTDTKPLNHAQNPNANILKNCERIDDCEDAIEDVTDRLDADEGDLDSLTKSITIYDTPKASSTNQSYGDGALHTYKDEEWANLEGIVKMIKRLYGDASTKGSTLLQRANLINLALEMSNLPQILTYTGYVSNAGGGGFGKYLKLNIGRVVILAVHIDNIRKNYPLDVDAGYLNDDFCSIIKDAQDIKNFDAFLMERYSSISGNVNGHTLRMMIPSTSSLDGLVDADVILMGVLMG